MHDSTRHVRTRPHTDFRRDKIGGTGILPAKVEQNLQAFPHRFFPRRRPKSAQLGLELDSQRVARAGTFLPPRPILPNPPEHAGGLSQAHSSFGHPKWTDSILPYVTSHLKKLVRSTNSTTDWLRGHYQSS
ncbi:hypothetical protein KEM48_010040 [Puccinia striiformis f. sp. tritici PST-130]|nr:hypothetical protein KEM48_010040 [Puccinia striiformis f. sp. tritici PST-130]